MTSPRSFSLSESATQQLRRLLDQASDELERCLRGGEACRVEDLLARYPQLLEHPPFVLDLIGLEFVLRQQLGQTPSVADYCARFPQWRESLEEQLPVLSAIPTSGWAEVPTIQERPARADSAATLTRPVSGRRLGHYQLLERIGHGGMGDVYRAQQYPPLERIVALKLLRTGDDYEIRTFTKEIEVARRLRHANLLPIYDAGCIEGEYYYTMPLLPGGSLEKRLRQERPDVRWTVTVLEKVARAVHYAHQQNVLHRDLKPANILLDERDEPLVADFGLAKLIDSSMGQTQTGQLLGSVPYMSPEQASGQSHRATSASDVWSLGVILYEMLTGQRPFQGENHSEVLQRIQRVEPFRPRQLQMAVPAELEAICLKCLEKDLAWRYPSAEQLAEDLAGWLKGVPPLPSIPSLAAHLNRTAWRRLRLKAHSLLIVASLGLLVLILLLLPAPSASFSRRDESPAGGPAALLAVENRLRPGKTFPLFECGRRAPWRQIVFGEKPAKLDWQPGEPLTLSTRSICLLELLPPNPRRGAYRLHVRLRQTDADEDGVAGVYVGRLSHAARAGIGHSFIEAAFLEPTFRRNPDAPANLSLTSRFLFEGADGIPGTFRAAPFRAIPFRPRPAGDNTPPYRDVSIEVTAQSIRVASDATQGPQRPLQDFEKRFRRLRLPIPLAGDGETRFSPQGGAGILLIKGSIDIRSVVFTLLEEHPHVLPRGEK